MTSFTRGLIVAAATLSIATGPVFAQATVGPAGGTPSTTAPTNGEGTPSGGTGTLMTTRVGPSTTKPAARSATSHRTMRRYARHATPAKGTTPSSAPSDAASPAAAATGAGAGAK